MTERKLTPLEQQKLLENLYAEIYQDEQDFHGAGSSRFEDEHEDHDDDVDVPDVDNEADDVDFESEAVDPNLDMEVPIDDTEVECYQGSTSSIHHQT